MLLGLVQLTSSDDVLYNLQRVELYIAQLSESGVQLIVLPENFAAFGMKQYRQLASDEADPEKAVIIPLLKKLAIQYQVWICAGTIPLQPIRQTVTPNSVSNPNAATLLIDNKGQITARYNKIHLFDAQVQDQQKNYSESLSYAPGRSLTIIDSPFGRLGLAVCYDLRFAEMFLEFRRRGVDVVLLPSAFTQATGSAHWETLIRCRAIENGLFIAAANQGGCHFNQRHTWGHSMVVDPWGTILGELDQLPGVLTMNIDTTRVPDARQAIPTHWHRAQRHSRNLQW